MLRGTGSEPAPHEDGVIVGRIPCRDPCSDALGLRLQPALFQKIKSPAGAREQGISACLSKKMRSLHRDLQCIQLLTRNSCFPWNRECLEAKQGMNENFQRFRNASQAALEASHLC